MKTEKARQRWKQKQQAVEDGGNRDQEVSGGSSWDLAYGLVQKKPLEPRCVLRSVWSWVVSRHHEASFPGGQLQDLR